MIELVKRWILFRIKSTEFRIRTWKNSYRISKAYSLASSSSTSPFHYRNFFKTGILLVFGTVILTGIVFGIIKIIKMDLFHKPEVAIAHKDQKNVQQGEMDIDSDKKNIKKEASKEQAIVSENKEIKTVDQPLVDSLQNKQSEILDTVKRVAPSVDPSLFVYDSSAIPVLDDGSDFMAIVANKANHALFVLHKNAEGKWSVIRSYFMAIGAQQGRKLTAGDKRTPEGLYLIVERKEQNELSSVYGPLAYVLDYPNQIDYKEGRTGQGIWIHGTEKDSFPIETKGCLELNNPDLIDLSRLLKSGTGTPVIIVNDGSLKNPASLLDPVAISQRQKVLVDSLKGIEENFVQFMSGWVSAWESRDIDRYAQYYDQGDFSSQGMDWDAWREKKYITFTLYDTIVVTYSKFAVLDITDSSAIVKFAQVYKTEKVKFENNKKLNLEKEQGTWKITREAAF